MFYFMLYILIIFMILIIVMILINIMSFSSPGKFLNQFIQNEETNTAGKEVLLTIFILIQDSIVFT